MTGHPLCIGFIPLVDAAPLIVAVDKGFAAAEGLEVTLVREVSWSNVRDKLNIGLFDAAHLGWRFPVRSLADVASETSEGFAFYGPTCDDADYMKGPFPLPADIQAGDYIEIGMLGAYGAAMRTGFNGFGQGGAVEVSDEPMSSLYTGRADPRVSDNVVSLR